MYDRVKRLMDVCGALALAIACLPVVGLAALAVRLSMGSPVLFRQTRAGLHGRLFVLRKLRTMRDAAGGDAERLTRLGRWLRASSIDELPQLWNVVCGEMSLVGPRPLLPEYLARYTAAQARRHEVRPGITGLTQVSGRNGLTWAEKFALDVRYVDERSLGLDAWILARTVSSVLLCRGVSARGHVTMPAFAGETVGHRSPDRSEERRSGHCDRD
jgi:lipopolysaccharide/colanic/teichoic acid biosynthesis glycosyltransferase